MPENGCHCCTSCLMQDICPVAEQLRHASAGSSKASGATATLTHHAWDQSMCISIEQLHADSTRANCKEHLTTTAVTVTHHGWCKVGALLQNSFRSLPCTACGSTITVGSLLCLSISYPVNSCSCSICRSFCHLPACCCRLHTRTHRLTCISFCVK